jgi:ABC-type branched-subunit amino acid transport system ATPase component
MPSPDQVLLRVDKVSKSFGGLKALDKVSLEVKRGCIHAIIGPNGSGKTTLFNVLSGLYIADSGKVSFLGQDISGLATHQRSRLGLARTFQQVRLFSSLTVRQNILASYLEHQRSTILRRMVSHSAGGHSYVDEVIGFFGLERFAGTTCGSLPYGIQKITEIARAVVSKPQILMLDEPVNGMNAEEVAAVCGLFRKIRQELGVTILLIEHNMSLVMNECSIVSVLSYGQNLAEGTPLEVSTNQQVIEAYLGKRGGSYVA